MSDTGRLLVCATPIGNLGDVTLRVLDALRDAHVIVAEDTRVTRKLLARYDIHTPLERYDEATAEARTPELVERIAGGASVALVSDAGTPGISDPGERLVDACISAGLHVDVLPGASAIITALVSSGLPTRAFYFGGFLPRKAGEIRRTLDSLAALEATLIFYESPRRAAASLAIVAEAFPGRAAAMARELTKIHEEIARDNTQALVAALAGRELKGEVVLLIGPPCADEAPVTDERAVRSAVALHLSEGMTRKDAVKRVAADLGVARNEVYRLALDKGEC
ncbi:MAG: 16S rRNA (cytidine(1402)-2'-O)-methyltransferase [Actinobacteria bacterium HGW-Actinobacteria-6]|jgi:16S rRNA (cytidine1402-2'-O)-methyltransferase|nr:MAG: 16S rRNA (cytidine(1402)-2'-O)-methyltransferase [Actinobacteria bacterium HGW-Actinobacteria-6]